MHKQNLVLCGEPNCTNPAYVFKTPKCRIHYNAVLRARKGAKCHRCDSLAVPGKTLCTRHAKIVSKASARRFKDNKKARKCTACGDPATETTTVCEKHKQIARNTRLVNEFGITLDAYNAILTAQNNVCAVCKQAETSIYLGKPKALAVDHDHVTGVVRGLLCSGCNVSLGLLKEDPVRIRNLAAYVEATLSGAKPS